MPGKYELYMSVCPCQRQAFMSQRIIGINVISIEKIISKVDMLIPHETDEFVRNNDVGYLTNLEILKAFDFIGDFKATWAFQKDNEETISMDISTVKNSIPILGYRITQPSPTFFKGKDDFYGYWYKYISEDKTFYFRYDTCYDRETRKANGFDDYNTFPVFSGFLKGMEDVINSSDIDKFIIDLRYNSGGNGDLLNPFIYLCLYHATEACVGNPDIGFRFSPDK